MKKGAQNKYGLMLLGTVVSLGIFAGAALAAGGDGGDKAAMMKDFAWRVGNFVILIGLLYWILAKKLKSFFAGRRAEIRETLEEARKAKEEAEQSYKAYVEKLDRATAEIDDIVGAIRARGLAEKEAILAEARKSAAKIEEDTRARMEMELQEASLKLRAEAVRLSVSMAEELLKRQITPQDHERMVEDYLNKVVTKH